MIHVEFTNQQTALPVDEHRLARAARLILADHGPETAELSVAVVDNPTIHELNRRFLRHDYPTDVLSFVLEEQTGRLEGEVIVSAEMAAAEAPTHDMRPEDELLLYLIHGVLHLVGFDDNRPDQCQQMRAAQRHYLGEFAVADRCRDPDKGGGVST
ncbi:MAG: rRNA maturation RNase YbeY [Planctomycetota bacterium]